MAQARDKREAAILEDVKHVLAKAGLQHAFGVGQRTFAAVGKKHVVKKRVPKVTKS